MKIAILDDYQDVVKNLNCFSLLNQHQVLVLNKSYPSVQELSQQLQDIEVLVLIRERTEITEELLQQLPNLQLISQTGKVSNHIDVGLCASFGVKVAEGVGSPIAPSELCWALVMSAMRHIPQYVGHLKQSQWQDSGLSVLGKTLYGKSFGIWGYGKIGKRIAKYADAFGMRVVVWGSDASRKQAELDGYNAALSKQEFFSDCDVVSLHLRLNDETRAIVTAQDLALMKSDSLLVNISRAELIETNALYAEMLANPLKSAAVDVFEQEPIDLVSEPLLQLKNVICSPHLGYVEQNSYELYFQAAFENILAFANGTPKNIAGD
ncbi:D-2-hydroxyacid dehydrogenase family protein [Vibrio sp. SCSIO 43136]|uniref:D-2-hydroxyacid dehydrogenase family protein n=1 Tax=Vibrio sp. SCSIO 43136 TaxID=2819101 RepID=UPI0020751C67|nr:D-2-hydroxyacid dehydrogenase family protein [Vibrio sp. SCSIO 43136]USD64034.1 D-2-hydroxyacid dehydrogenase family protein [Vibrio sp. SCSIO 43136]